MWSSLWTRLGKRARFWLKLLAFSSVLHVALLFFMFFIYSGQNSIFEININRSILKSGAPIVFLPSLKVSPSKRAAKTISKKPVAVKKTVVKKSPVKKTTIAKKKPVAKKTAPKKHVKKPAVKKQPAKKTVSQKKKPLPTKKTVKKNLPKKSLPKKSASPVKKPEKTLTQKKPEPVKKLQETPQPIYIGQKELEVLSVQYEIEREVAKHWRPPAGLSKDLTCTIHVLVDWNGKSKQAKVKKTSGVLIYDISARMAVAKLNLPKSVRGKEINITFNQ